MSTHDVGVSGVRACIPRIEVHDFLCDPGAVAEAEFEGAHPHDPIGARAQHCEQGDEVVQAVHAEHGERPSLDVGVPQTPGLYDRPDLAGLEKK